MGPVVYSAATPSRCAIPAASSVSPLSAAAFSSPFPRGTPARALWSDVAVILEIIKRPPLSFAERDAGRTIAIFKGPQ